MIFVHPDDIIIPEGRFRKEFNERKMAELRESITRNGLINPLTVERTGDDRFTLRAGERRLRVLKGIIQEGISIRCGIEAVPGTLVPAIEWGTLTELQRLEIEIEENLNRDDFTWQERTQALASLHKLRAQQNPRQTASDTATEAKGEPANPNDVTEVSNALIISRHLSDPEVAKAKDSKEAIKVIKRKTDNAHRAVLAQKFDLTKTEHRLIQGDAGAVLQAMPAASFDIILTDPPYGVGADDFGDQSGTGHDYEDSLKNLESILTWLPDESYRVAKDRAHCYLFCDVRRFERISTLMVLAGWKVFPTPLIWFKGNGMVPLPKHGPRRTYECILFAYKGDRETIVLKNDCITKIPAVKKLRHGAQKPVALYCELLSRSANPGDAVLDCFGGSGPILVAANRMRLVATYVEQSKEHFDYALTRVHTKEIDDGAEEDDGISIDFSAV